MIEINPKRFKTTPTDEQVDGVKHIVTREASALFDRPGFGKTKQVIDAACILYEAGEIDTVLVISPASVRGVWDEPHFGELTKHCWVPFRTIRFNKKCEKISNDSTSLLWVITSYGFIRKSIKIGKTTKYPEVARLIALFKGRKTYLVLDESSYIKSKDANQFKACKKLRESL